MLALKKIRGSCCLTAAAVFGFTLSALFTQSLSALTQDKSVSVQAVHSAAPQSGNSIIPPSASQQEKLLRAVVSQLSLEEKAAMYRIRAAEIQFSSISSPFPVCHILFCALRFHKDTLGITKDLPPCTQKT